MHDYPPPTKYQTTSAGCGPLVLALLVIGAVVLWRSLPPVEIRPPAYHYQTGEPYFGQSVMSANGHGYYMGNGMVRVQVGKHTIYSPMMDQRFR